MNTVALESKDMTLVETLDAALNKGVVLSGDLTISVADVDLIFLGLRVLLTSVETAEKRRWGCKRDEYEKENGKKGLKKTVERKSMAYEPPPLHIIADEQEKVEAVLPDIDTHPDRIEKGLGKLVLTLIELIRGVIERQAVRRVEGQSLTDEEIERLGETLMKLECKMEELKKVFGLKDEDLTLNLGPLGDLL